MPTVPVARSDKEKRARSILSFAEQLIAGLAAATSVESPGSLFTELQSQLAHYPSKLGAASKAEEFDRTGTALWNLCTRLRRDTEDPLKVPVVLLMARVFAFLLLDVAHENGKSTTLNLVRLMKIGLKASKNCLTQKQSDLALKALGKVADYETQLHKESAKPSPEDEALYGRLSAEYFILRTVLAWRQEQFDVAEHMFSKSVESHKYFDPRTAESLADVLFEMGKELFDSKQNELAVKWLGRAYEVIIAQDLDRLSGDASELRISIMQTLVKALLASKQTALTEKASSIVALLESELGNKVIVLLLKLELITSSDSEVFDDLGYSDVLHRMIRSVILDDSNFRLIMHHIRKLNEKSPTLAHKSMDDFIRLRVLQQGGKDEWLEKVLLTRMWMTVGQRDTPEALASLMAFLTTIMENINRPVSSNATLAAHTLLWKRIEGNYTQKKFEAAENWCRLAMHRVFGNSGEQNMARIQRKLLLCASARKDMGTARDVFASMTASTKDEPMTRFLMFKIAMRCDEVELAAECLEKISASSDSRLLYACVLDAQQVGHKPHALAALQIVLERHGYETSQKDIHLPSLLRITIGLMAQLLESSEKSAVPAENVEKLCMLFEGAAKSVKKTTSAGSKNLWTALEIEWFSKNSYNFAIKNLPLWNPRHSLRMLVCCISFINHRPKDISEQDTVDCSLRKLFCEFSASIALVSLARSNDVIEEQLQDYLNLRKHIASFDDLLQEMLDRFEASVGEDAVPDLVQKLAILLAFDCEAACQLKAWDDLGEIILKAEACSGKISNNIRTYELMADCILSSQAPAQVLITNLKKIVNEVWALDSLDGVKLAKYMRCLFQIALADHADIAEQLLQQIKNMALQAAETDCPYPTPELEWIAIRAFNHGIDLYVDNRDEDCKNWILTAIGIAHVCADEGSLEKELQGKYLILKWDH